MCQSAQREGILIYIVTLPQQLADEISATNVMCQVAEFLAAKRVITQVLDDGASVGIGMSFFDLIVGQAGKSLEQHRADLVGPEQVHNFLVGQNRVSERTAAVHHQEQKKGHRTGCSAAANGRLWRGATGMSAWRW